MSEPSREIHVGNPALEADLRDRLEAVEEALAEAVRTDTPTVSEAGDYLLRAGGKRFRPMLLLLGSRFGNAEDPRLIAGAVATELVHLATLYHDDVIDEADVRRGIPSANVRWGNTVAILTGDFLFARASGIASELGAEVTRLLAATIAKVCEGQIREVEASRRPETDEATYMAVIERKTASLISAACRLGGMLSEADPAVTDTLERYGHALGLAFQLSDDVMDLVSDEATLGKHPAADLKEGVQTLPVIVALRESERREELRTLLRAPAADGLDRALEIIRGDGALSRAREAVTLEVRRALREAERLPGGPARSALESLAAFLAERCGAAV
ncbi:MAG TPA: polyprenyl synthetase family protein [Actinomycetota bacterium]|nr:polyprenyl synthetase family protein [Actinomycetota bacterium]